MKIRRVLAMCKYEFIVAVLAALMAIPTIVPQSQATAVIGGGDIDCYGISASQSCSSLPNNAGCTGNYTNATATSRGTQEKEMKTEKWCSSCDTDVTQFDLVASDKCNKTVDVEEYENIP